MDPNETLAELRAALEQYFTAPTAALVESAAQDVAEYTDNLITWLDRGGTIPDDWQR